MERLVPFGAAGNGVSVSLAVTTVSHAVQFDNINPPAAAPNVSPTPNIAMKSRCVRLFNAGPDLIFFELVGPLPANQTATIGTGVPLPAGKAETFSTAGSTSIAAVALTSNSTLYITPGEGIGTS